MSQREVDPYAHIGWVDRAGNVRHYPSGYSPAELMSASPDGPDPTGPLVDEPGSVRGKPKLVRDQPFWYKWLIIIPVMTIVAAIGAKLASYGFAAIYYNIFETSQWMVSHWHAFASNDFARHLVRDVMFEKMPAFAALQIVVYNFANHWPRKPANRLDRIEAFLRVPNARIDNQGVLSIILGIPYLLLYSGVGFAALVGSLYLAGYSPAYPASWLITLTGLFASWVFGRRVAKGLAYHTQRLIIRERREDGKTKPAWWMLWPLRWRFEWNVSHPETAIKPSRRWNNYKLQRALHRATKVALVLIAFGLVCQGFVILYQAAHGPIAWDAYWTAIKYGVTAWL